MAWLYLICAGLFEIGWPVGHVYRTADDDPTMLVSTDIWYLQDEDRFRSFRDITLATSFAVGEGLPGRVVVRLLWEESW